MHRWC